MASSSLRWASSQRMMNSNLNVRDMDVHAHSETATQSVCGRSLLLYDVVTASTGANHHHIVERQVQRFV